MGEYSVGGGPEKSRISASLCCIFKSSLQSTVKNPPEFPTLRKINRMTETFDGSEYMKRLADRERPMPRDSPLLIQPLRPQPQAAREAESQGSKKAGWTRPSEDPGEYQRLKK